MKKTAAWIYRPGQRKIKHCYLVDLDTGEILRSCAYEYGSDRAGEENADRMARLEREVEDDYEIDYEYPEPSPEFKRIVGPRFVRY